MHSCRGSSAPWDNMPPPATHLPPEIALPCPPTAPPLPPPTSHVHHPLLRTPHHLAKHRLYYMPTAADSLVASVRAWMEREAGGGPFGSLADPSSPAATAAARQAALGEGQAPAPAGSADGSVRRQLLDRYQQHTVHCASCRWVGARGAAAGCNCGRIAWSPLGQCDVGGCAEPRLLLCREDQACVGADVKR